MTQEDFQKHQLKQTDLKQLIQILTPLSGINPNVDPDVQKMAIEKLKEFIPQVQAGIKDTIVKTLSSLGPNLPRA